MVSKLWANDCKGSSLSHRSPRSVDEEMCDCIPFTNHWFNPIPTRLPLTFKPILTTYLNLSSTVSSFPTIDTSRLTTDLFKATYH